MYKLIWVILTSLFIPNISFALFCPKNFNVIAMGDNIADVRQKCGAPDTDMKKEVEKEGPQEWSYFLPQTVATGTSYQSTGTLKVTIAFDKSNRAININVNGIGVGESTICGNPIKLDDSRETVKAACGKPAMVNKNINDGDQSSATPADNKDTIEEYQYLSNPPVVLVFTNGVLTGTR